MKTASCCPPPGGSYGSAGFYAATGSCFLLALALTLYLVKSMAGGMDMPGGWRMSMMWMPMPGQGPLGSLAMFLPMWAAMMTAMMLPSLAPKLLLFHRSLVWRRAPLAALSTLGIALGYFTVWTAYGMGAWVLGYAWAGLAMGSPAFSRAVPFLVGLALMLAGAYQLIPWKGEGLNRCRALLVYGPPKRRKKGEPEVKLMRWSGFGLSYKEGLRQGLNCVLCCFGTMLAMVVLGAMNLYVMVGITLVIALEKLLPNPRPFVTATGLAAFMTGVVLMVKLFH